MERDLVQIIVNGLDILLVAYLIYRGLLIIKGTRAVPMIIGLSAIVLLYFVSKPLGLTTLSWILGNFLSSIILVVVIIFQEEIRRGLTKFGLQSIMPRSSRSIFDKVIEDITLLASSLSDKSLGALIVIQGDVGLDDFVEDAVIIDSAVNRKLLYSIFQKNSPLHDGAVLIDGNRIRAAGCVLPLSFNPDLDPSLGTRHRAALGITEVSDAVAVVVSEETGNIALARDGKLYRNLDGGQLKEHLINFLKGESSNESEEGEDVKKE